MKKILMLAGFAPSLLNFRKDLIKTLLSKGYKVFACAPYEEKTKKKLISMGVSFCPLALKRTGSNPFYDLSTFVSLIKIIKRKEPDIIFSYTHKASIYGSLAARFFKNTQSYSMLTGFGYSLMNKGVKGSFYNHLMSFLFKISINHNSKNFFQNEDLLKFFLQKKMVKSKHRQILVNGSGVNLKKFSQTNLPKKISFLMISRLLVDKGIREYIESAKIIKKNNPNVSFILAGDLDSNPSSIKKDELDSWVKSGIIQYLGFLKDVRPAISKCSVYILPSYCEGMPRTVLEAMSMGRPIITTDAPGCRQSIENGKNGFLVPIKNVEKLVESMQYFIDNPKIIPAMGEKSRDLAKEKFDVHKVNYLLLKEMEIIKNII